MRLRGVVGWMLLAVLGAAMAASAATYEYTPTPPDLEDLPHTYVYEWGVDISLAPGEQIYGATLDLTDVWDADDDAITNALYIHLLDNPIYGVMKTADVFPTADDLAGTTSIATYVDPDGWDTKEDLHYDLGTLGLLPTLNSYAADGRFGIGFDPDCHYINTDIKLCLTTRSSDVPEPTTLLLLAAGGAPLLGLVVRRRRS